MSTGLRALMAAAEEAGDAVKFPVMLTTGELTVSGRVAPSKWWYQAAERDFESQADRVVNSSPKRDREHARTHVSGLLAELAADMNRAKTAELQPPDDEVTLYEASVFPTISTGGTQSGGMHMAVIRVPLSAVDNWWIVEAREIKGRGGINWGVGWVF